MKNCLEIYLIHIKFANNAEDFPKFDKTNNKNIKKGNF